MIPDARRWRRWTWLVLLWTVAMLALALVATSMLGGICDELEGIGFAFCSAGSVAGTVLAWLLVGTAWMIGFLFLVLFWFARKPARRLCPPYGHPVDTGQTTCRKCGYDFAAANPLPVTAPPAPPAPAAPAPTDGT